MVLRFICIFTDFSKYLSRAYLCYILCYTLLSTQLISEDGRELFTSSCWRKLIPKIIIPLEVDKGYINDTLVLWENNRISNISARAAWENWQKRLHLMWILIDEQEISKQRSCAILIPTSGPLHMLFHLPGRLFPSILPPPPPFILQDMTLLYVLVLPWLSQGDLSGFANWFSIWRNIFIRFFPFFLYPLLSLQLCWHLCDYLINVCFTCTASSVKAEADFYTSSSWQKPRHRVNVQ